MGLEKYLSALLFFLILVKSCFSAETFMNTTLALKENIFLSLYTDNESYCEPELVNITNAIENKGNLEASGNLTTKIFNPDSQEVKSQTWQVLVRGAEIKHFITNY
ncbi:MAG: hypothetical protein QW472_05550, partial [Candidatus Aenigmatarchaeota archaeon]